MMPSRMSSECSAALVSHAENDTPSSTAARSTREAMESSRETDRFVTAMRCTVAPIVAPANLQSRDSSQRYGHGVSMNTLLAFSAATLLLLIIPGPAVMYIVTRSAAQGRRAGVVSVAGIHAGTIVHVIAAMVGLSAILAASATAFTLVKLAGAVYLVWLGLQSLRSYRSNTGTSDDVTIESRSFRRILLDGAVLNVLNPKTAIFFLSFVPQFVDPQTAHPVRDVAMLGGLFIALGLVTDGIYALAGGWVGSRLRRSPHLQRRKDLFAGSTYVGLGAVTALRS